MNFNDQSILGFNSHGFPNPSEYLAELLIVLILYDAHFIFKKLSKL